MTITEDLEELQQIVKKFNQEHLLTFWDELSELEREILKNDIKDIDFQLFTKDFEKAGKKSASNRKRKVDNELEPPSPDQCGSWTSCTQEQLKRYDEIGLEYIANGEYCAILMAGGLGTRLGVNYPKGMYNVGLPSGKSLFQLQAERLLRLQNLALKRFGKTLPIMWYIMTSDFTREPTLEYFQKNRYFGLTRDQINFFEQCTLPAADHDGKILLESKFRISKSPDGNGGLFRALNKYNLIDDMKYRGIKYANVYGVDNILVKVADPVFLGFCVEQDAECAAKVIEKISPGESVGIVVKFKGHMKVVEYSEISYETATMRDQKEDKLMYRCGSICIHLFSIDFLSRICRDEVSDKMMQHIALKKIPFINTSTGLLEIPSKENAIKLEKFVFDVFPYSKKFAVWEVERNHEFSPLKNSSEAQVDCPETCRENLIAYHKQLVLNNLGDINLMEKVKKMTLEISPLVSYSGEGLKNVSQIIEECESSVLHIESIY